MKSSDVSESLRLLQLGVAHLQNQQNKDALKVLLKAVRLNPQDVYLWCVLGHAQERIGLQADGRQSFIRAHKLDPQYPLALRNLAAAELNIGNAERALALTDAAFAIDPSNQELTAIMLLASTVSMSVDADALYSRHVLAAHAREQAIQPLPPAIQGGKLPNSIIRIGYFSHHFYRFPLASFLPHVMAAHDRQKFRVYAFAALGLMDEITDLYIKCADEFHDLASMTDDEAAQYIRALKIDILVDVSGLVQFNRFGILARRPARVQMSWLGYFSSTASPALDFHITDSHANPIGITEHLFTERLIRLPHSQYAYRPLVDNVPVLPSPYLQNGVITFGWFCAPSKLNEVALNAYAAIVAAVPDSRMVFVCPSKDLQQQIINAFQRLHVKRQRLTFLPKLAPDAYFHAITSVDISLDCFPMVGGTTVFDAIWMGTPVISMFLPRGFGGASSSVLNHVGLGKWIAVDVQSFIDNAIALANDKELLKQYRNTLQLTMQNSALMNIQGLSQALQQCYEDVLQEQAL